MNSDAHISDAHALIRRAATEDRSLSERQLRLYLMARQCNRLARVTGLSLAEVVEIYNEEQVKL